MTFKPLSKTKASGAITYVRLTADLDERVKAEAERYGVTGAELIRQCIDYALDNMDEIE